jgi:coenzyme PQQ synthesis protein D (PqqD)
MAGIYKIASAQITSEFIEGEVMIINLQNGSYYNIEGVGAEIWQAVVEGASFDKISERIQNRFEGEAGTIQNYIKTFLKELHEEKLLVPEETAVDSTNYQPPSTINLTQVKPPFAPPVLNKFTDMQELLLLDPIHEVDEAGWPRAKQK